VSVRILQGDCRAVLPTLPAESVNCVLTSPPYFGLRSYLTDGHPDKAREIGLEPTPGDFVAAMVEVFRKVRRVLRDDGTVWLNLGDSYAGSWGAQSKRMTPGEMGRNSIANHPKTASRTGAIREPGLKQKDLIGIPWRVAFALRADGWWLRDAIVWAKPNAMPGSQEDRCTSSYEMVFMLTKSAHYWCDFNGIKTPPRESSLIRNAQDIQAQAGSHRANGGGKTNGPMKAVGVRVDTQCGHGRRHDGFNERWDGMERAEQQSRPAMMRNVWFVPPASYRGEHFAVMPDEIARRCILAGCPPQGVVLDPFGGAGTTGLVADRLQREAILIDINTQFVSQAASRLGRDAGMLAAVEVGAA
jgi:DNA modification methylase